MIVTIFKFTFVFIGYETIIWSYLGRLNPWQNPMKKNIYFLWGWYFFTNSVLFNFLIGMSERNSIFLVKFFWENFTFVAYTIL
jgi:hypothetical protein